MHSDHVVIDADRLAAGPRSESGLDDVGGPRSAYLLRPYLDLSPFEAGPSFATSVDSAFLQVADEAAPALMIQTHPHPNLRSALVRETGLPAYGIRFAEQLPPRLRTERWNVMLELIGAERAGLRLSTERRARLATLLNTLGLYDETVRLFADIAYPVDGDYASTRLALRHAMALNRTRRSAESAAANLRLLSDVARNARGDLYVRLGAAVTLVVAYAKGPRRDLAEVKAWRELADRLYASLDPEAGLPDVLHASAYWRAVSFVPYLEGDFRRTAEELDLAEFYAARFEPSNEAERFAWWQNTHPLLETRAREAFDAGDLKLAVERAVRLVELDPLCAKSRGHLGNLALAAGDPAKALGHFRRGVELGAPYTAFAWYMVGHCADLLGDRRAARAAWLESVRHDPGGIDARRRISALAVTDLVDDTIRTWAEETKSTIVGNLREQRAAPPATVASTEAGAAA